MGKCMRIALCICFAVCLSLSVASAAHIQTEDSYYIDVQCALGRQIILIPRTVANNLVFGDTAPYVLNQGTANVTGYFVASTSAVNDVCIFPAFSDATYRYQSGNSTYTGNLNITRVYDSNLPQYTNSNIYLTDSNVYIFLIAITTLLALMVLFFIVKRR